MHFQYIEKLEKTLEYNRGLQGAMNLSLDRKDAKIRSLETSLREQSALLFDEESDTDLTTEDPSSLVRECVLSFHYGVQGIVTGNVSDD